MLTALSAVAVSLVLTGLLVPVLHRARFWDVPNHRSSHVTPTPRGGGIAVMVAVVVALLWTREDALWWVLAVTSAVALLGLADDVRSLPASVRLLGQLAGAVAVVAGLTWGYDDPLARLAAAGLAAVGFVAYVNAFNFMDGVNGISALNAVVAGGWFAWLGRAHDRDDLMVAGLALAGAAIGFLPWNLAGWVFLGDVGSYGVGALIAGLAVLAWSGGLPGPLALAPLLVYLADTAWALVQRKARGARLGEAHREHVYQQLVDRAGWSHFAAGGWCALAAGLAAGLMWWLAEEVRMLAGIGAALVVVLVYLATPTLVGRRS